VEAALALGVPSELREQELRAIETGCAIEHRRSLARREPDHRHVALAPAVIDIVDAAEADDRRPPHRGLLARRIRHELDERLRIAAPCLVGNGRDEARNTGLGRRGLVPRHAPLPRTIHGCTMTQTSYHPTLPQ